MPVKIRLQRHGRKKAPFYHIVIADSRSPRDGKFIEKIGTYNPMTKPALIEIDRLKAFDWLNKGAQPTDTVRAILRFKGVLFRKHLMRGVAKNAMTLEEADAKWLEWIENKESKITSRKAQTAEEKRNFLKMVSGAPKAKPTPATETPAAEDTVEENAAPEPAAEELAESIVEETTPVAEAEAPAAEEVNDAVEEVIAEFVAPAAEVTAEAEETSTESTQPADEAAAESESTEEEA